MAEPQEFADFCSPAYKLETPNASCSRCINQYPEVVEKGPRTGKLRLRGIPGLKDFTTLPDSPLRALLQIDGGNRCFAVAGQTVFEVFKDGTFTAMKGTVGASSRPAIMVSNGFQLFVASAGRAYIVNGVQGGGGIVSPLTFTDGTPVGAGTIDFLDQYVIANPVSTKQVFISNLAPDGATWDPGNTAIKEGYADNISRLLADSEYLWLFGFETLEVWVNTGDLFPFNRLQGAVYSIGCDAPYSVAKARGYRFWKFQNVVYCAQGTDAQRISDYGVEQAIKSYGDTSDAEGWCYVDGGHLFYVLNFPSAQRTWVYDMATAPGPVGPVAVRAWHERLFWNNGQYSQYRARVYCKAFNMDLVGDYQNGKIYQLDPNTYTDAGGVPLRRQRICPYLTVSERNMRYNRLILDMDTGIGIPVAAGQPGADPQVVMKYSSNRGKTWSNERSTSAGAMGADDTRVVFKQLGSSRLGMAFDINFTEPCAYSVNGAYLDIGAPEAGR